MFILVLIFIIQVSKVYMVSQSIKECEIDINNEIQLNSPIILNSDTENIIYQSGGKLKFLPGKIIELACPGGKLKNNSQTTAKATCTSTNNFLINNNTVEFHALTCTQDIVNTAKFSGNKCENNNYEIIIGFEITKQRFIKLMSICFDITNQNPLYSTYDLTKHIDSAQTNVPRPFFEEGKLYNIDVNQLYTRKEQMSTINTQLGLDPQSTKYIKKVGNDFLSRGHLTVKADFVYGVQQRATFHYVNAAPQWQSFNGINWKSIETAVKDYAIKNKVNLKVYTGTYGKLTLPHEQTGKNIELYLHVKNGQKAIPVPEIFWKVIYDPASGTGVAIVGVNNPFISKEKYICKTISSKIKWINMKGLRNFKNGFCYACTVNDLRKIINYIPEFNVTSLLV